MVRRPCQQGKGFSCCHESDGVARSLRLILTFYNTVLSQSSSTEESAEIPCSEVVITLDFESSIRSSNLRRGIFCSLGQPKLFPFTLLESKDKDRKKTNSQGFVVCVQKNQGTDYGTSINY